MVVLFCGVKHSGTLPSEYAEKSEVTKSAKDTNSPQLGEEKLQGHTEDALALPADEGRGTLRKAPGRRVQPMMRRYPNGETHTGACLCTLG